MRKKEPQFVIRVLKTGKDSELDKNKECKIVPFDIQSVNFQTVC